MQENSQTVRDGVPKILRVSAADVACRVGEINRRMRASRPRELTEAERERKELKVKFGE